MASTIHVDNLTIDFKQTAPSKLYWSGRPAKRIVQALQVLLERDYDAMTMVITGAVSPFADVMNAIGALEQRITMRSSPVR